MPVYEYECQTCEKVIETLQKMTDPPLEKCPDCGNAVEKLMSLSSFSLKGSGWYSTGYEKAAKSSTSDKSENSNANSKEKADSKTSGGDAKEKPKETKTKPEAPKAAKTTEK